MNEIRKMKEYLYTIEHKQQEILLILYNVTYP